MVLVDDSTHTSTSNPPPPLPNGWILKKSRSQPGYYYYFHQETGISSWQPPEVAAENEASEEETPNMTNIPSLPSPTVEEEPVAEQPEEVLPPPAKKAKKDTPKQVRVLHILRKHKESRRPSSWRTTQVTISREEAIEEMKALLEILQEEKSDFDALKATFQELAKEESDCSSHKRGGDLGFFGRKKMRPEFEEASFNLAVGEMSGLVETSSGVHIILRIE